jgi:hypothetical protein
MRSTPDKAAAWGAGELDRIGQAEKLQLASRRQDGTVTLNNGVEMPILG